MKFNPLGFGRKGLTGGLGFKPTASSSSLNSALKGGKAKDGSSDKMPKKKAVGATGRYSILLLKFTL